ncbi:hypothetical protein QBC42DRAFT_43452 [Cladorrhinum samala]|uniref:Uncharacterized protein n=1 Tax=Cladorrhinum samala TaxID=585594 RepID=A0AAV9HUG3_9PEZI|nr:hypothetical protein QBC42DRAFT_43452 [Cladorrhinum samala]
MLMDQTSPSFDDADFLLQLWPDLLLSGKDRRVQIHDSACYSMLLQYFWQEMTMVEESPESFAITKPAGFVSLVARIQAIASSGISRTEALQVARELVVEEAPSEDQLMASVDVAVRLWLTVDVSSFKSRRQGLLSWKSTETLSEVVQAHFRNLEQEQPFLTPAADRGQVDSNLTAKFLVKYRGYNIIWTSNLAVHLAIDWEYKTITVYEHKVFLDNQLKYLTSSSGLPIPPAVLEEAIDTLNLLFPFQVDSAKRFLAKHKKPFYGLGSCGRPRKLDISDYRYWRSRVSDLGHITTGPPVGLQQLRLHNKGENLLQFATFWTAIAVGAFTVASIAIGLAALVYGKKQYELGLRQYQVSVYQLCLDPEAGSKFPDLCLKS